MKIPSKKPVIDLLAREIVNGYLFDLRGIKLPKNGIVNIYQSVEGFMNDWPVGKCRVVYKYGKLIAQLEDIDEGYFDKYLFPVITVKTLGTRTDISHVEKSKLDFIITVDERQEGSSILSIREQLTHKNHIQDYFTIEEIHRLCKLYKVGVLEISDYTGIQYNSLHQYLGGDKCKPTLPLSKVLKAALFLYFKGVFNHKY